MEPVEWVVASEYQPAGLDAEGASVVAKLILEVCSVPKPPFPVINCGACQLLASVVVIFSYGGRSSRGAERELHRHNVRCSHPWLVSFWRTHIRWPWQHLAADLTQTSYQACLSLAKVVIQKSLMLIWSEDSVPRKAEKSCMMTCNFAQRHE